MEMGTTDKAKTMNLEEIKTLPKNPDELFRFNNQNLDFRLVDFWMWNQSDLIENRNRGILAEFIVRQALEIKYPTRLEWDSFDLITDDGVKVEVKSAAYIQAWKQKKYSDIQFSIEPTRVPLEDNNYSEEKVRRADIYIFCLLGHKDQTTIDPMNLDQWVFYVLPTKILNEKLPNQKSISLNTLKSLNCQECDYGQLRMFFEKERKPC